MEQPKTIAEYISYLLEAVAVQAKAIEALCKVNDNQEEKIKELQRGVAELKTMKGGGKRRGNAKGKRG